MSDVKLTWQDNADNEDTYSVQRSDGDDQSFLDIATGLPPDTEEYTDRNVPDGLYYYRTYCSNAGGDSDFSNQVSVVLPIGLPAPTNLTGRVRKVAVIPNAFGNRFITGNVALATTTTLSCEFYFSFDEIEVANRSVIGQWGSGTNIWVPLITGANSIQFFRAGGNCIWEDVLDFLSPNQIVGVRIDVRASDATAYLDYGDGNWVSLGNRSLGGSFNQTSQPMFAGSRPDETNDKWGGRLYSARVWSDAYEGNLVAEFNPSYSDTYGLGRSWTAETGEVWTGQSNARVSAISNLVVDRFEDQDGTLLPAHTPDLDVEGGGWASVGASDGEHEIQSNQAVIANRTSGTPCDLIEAGSADCSVEADMIAVPVNSYGLHIRSVDTDTGWNSWINTTPQLLLYERNAGSQLRAGANVSSRTGQATLTAEGNTLTATLDDVSISHVSSVYNTETKCGLRSNGNGNTIDNFRVTSITDIPE